MEKKILLVSFIAIMVATEIWSYPNGPPPSTCTDMSPSHGANPPQSGASPFTLTANVNCLNPGQRILLTLRDPASPQNYFSGLLVQARMRSGPVNSYGVFDTNNQPGLQTISCFGGSSNSIGHSNNNDKSSVTFGWTAPSSLQSSIVFKYSVVKEFEDFWVGLEYELPLCLPSGEVPPDQTIPPPQPYLTTEKPSCSDQNKVICSLLNFRERMICQISDVKSFCCGSCSRLPAKKGRDRGWGHDSRDRF